MDSFEFNKIIGGVLGTALGVMALGIVAEAIYEPAEPEKPGYVIAVAESGGEAASRPAPRRPPWRRSPTACRPRTRPRA